jgi:predicted MFS family arabinose efflux permease
MAPLALVLAGRAVTGDFATGALLAGVCGLAQGFGAPWRGRLLDRPERTHALSIELVASAACFGALAAAVLAGSPVAVLCVLAAGGGLFASALPGGYLARLPATVPAELVPRALTATAVGVELSWVVGPLLVTACALLLPAAAAVALVAVSLVVALVSSLGLPARDWPAVPTVERAPWRDPVVRRTYAFAALVGMGFGIVDATMPALLDGVGLDPALAGILTGIPAGASVLTGTALLARRVELGGLRSWTSGALGVVAGVTLLPLALVSSFAGFALVLAGAGMLMSPMNAVWSHVLHGVLPSGRQAEGFGLLHASLRIGIGAGAAVSALLLPHVGAGTVVSVAGLVPLVGCGLVLLRPAPAPVAVAGVKA